MELDSKKVIEKIIRGMDCPRNFACYGLGLRSLCKVKDVKMKDYVEIKENGNWCKYCVAFEGKYFCKCPLCVHLTKRPNGIFKNRPPRFSNLDNFSS